MPDDFNPTEWIMTKEAAELTGCHARCLAGVPVAVLDKNDKVYEKHRWLNWIRSDHAQQR
jgi:hypothetical protein